MKGAILERLLGRNTPGRGAIWWNDCSGGVLLDASLGAAIIISLLLNDRRIVIPLAKKESRAARSEKINENIIETK